MIFTLLLSCLLVSSFLYINSGQLNINIINKIKDYGSKYGLNIQIKEINLLEDWQTIELKNVYINDINSNNFNIAIKALKLKPQVLSDNKSLFHYKLYLKYCELDDLSLDMSNIDSKYLQIGNIKNTSINSYITLDISNLIFNFKNSKIIFHKQIDNTIYLVDNINIAGQLTALKEQLNIKLNRFSAVISNDIIKINLINSEINIDINSNNIDINNCRFNTNIGILDIKGQIDASNFNYKLNIDTDIDLSNMGYLYDNQRVKGQILFKGLLNKVGSLCQLDGKFNINRLNIQNYSLDKITAKSIEIISSKVINININNLDAKLIKFNKNIINSIVINKLSLNIDNIKKNLLDINVSGDFKGLKTNLLKTSLKSSGKFNIHNKQLQVKGIVNNLNFASLLPKPDLLSINGNNNWAFQASSNINNRFILDLKIQNKGLIINGLATSKIQIATKINSLGIVKMDLAAKVANDWQYLKARLEMNKTYRPIFIESNISNLAVEPTIKKYFPTLANVVKGIVSGQLTLDGPTLNANGITTFEALEGKLSLTKVSLKVAGRPLNLVTPLDIPLNDNFKLEPSLLFSQKSAFFNF